MVASHGATGMRKDRFITRAESYLKLFVNRYFGAATHGGGGIHQPMPLVEAHGRDARSGIRASACGPRPSGNDRQAAWDGLAYDPRSAFVTSALDSLREGTLSPRPERFSDGIRSCRRIKTELERLISFGG